MVQALGLSFTVSTLALAGGLAAHGALPLERPGQICAALALAWRAWRSADGCAGGSGRGCFGLCFFAGLLVLGAELIVKSLG